MKTNHSPGDLTDISAKAQNTDYMLIVYIRVCILMVKSRSCFLGKLGRFCSFQTDTPGQNFYFRLYMG